MFPFQFVLLFNYNFCPVYSRHVNNNGTPMALTENIPISHKTEFQKNSRIFVKTKNAHSRPFFCKSLFLKYTFFGACNHRIGTDRIGGNYQIGPNFPLIYEFCVTFLEYLRPNKGSGTPRPKTISARDSSAQTIRPIFQSGTPRPTLVGPLGPFFFRDLLFSVYVHQHRK